MSATAGLSLDLHEGVSDAALGGARANGCPRWPEALRLLSSTGVVAKGRCGATNKCDYCARLAAVEIAERLALDAMESGNAPRVWIVLTTADANPDPSSFYDSRRQLMRALERRFPGLEWASVVEFTTGYGPLSGGLRRPHWNVLLKNVGTSPYDLARVEDAIRAVWCKRENAVPEAQYVGAVEHEGGLMRYLALHFLKESQMPPEGWKGHRFTVSKHTRHRPGYFGLPAWRSRKRAQESLRFKREVWRALRDGYAPGAESELVAEIAFLRAQDIRWELVKVEERVNVRTGELAPRAFALDGGEPRVWRPDRLLERDAACEFERLAGEVYRDNFVGEDEFERMTQTGSSFRQETLLQLGGDRQQAKRG